MTSPVDDLSRLTEWCASEALELDEACLQHLHKYLELLRFWAKKVALVGAAELPHLVDKHLADCLFVASRCPATERAADLGSGAGLPGIPIALARSDVRIDLVEARAKKASFLSVASTGLSNARVRRLRIEDLTAEYDVAVARALAPLDRLLPLCRPCLVEGGRLLAMKGARFEEELGTCNPSQSGFELSNTTEYLLPSGEERALLEFIATQPGS